MQKVTVWHFVVPALMVACASLVITCYIYETTNERLLVTNEILIRRNNLLDSLFKASDREDDSLRNRCDWLERSRDSSMFFKRVNGTADTVIFNVRQGSIGTLIPDTTKPHKP